MPLAADLSDLIAVGTVYEASDVRADRTALVLTPHVDRLPASLARSAVLTVGGTAHVDALIRAGWSGAVVVKLRSSMRRYGVDPDDLADVIGAVTRAGWRLAGWSIHLPLAGTDADHLTEIEGWLEHLDPAVDVMISHLDATSYATLRDRHPDRRFRIRVGTGLWHADKNLLHLSADVLDVHPVRRGDVIGYRATPVTADGDIVLIAAGSAHGVAPLDGGLSPFHHRRRRLALVEAPHMHTSMVLVPAGDPCPAIADRVDVQRPLITTTIDELEWIP